MTYYAFARCVALIVYLRHDFSSEIHVDWTCFRSQLRYAIPFGLAVVVGILQTNFHQYAVSHYFDAATLAIYSVGCLQIPIVDFIITPASSVMMVRMSERIGQGRSDGLLPMWHDMSRKLALMFFPLVALLLLNAHNIIILLFTERYLRSVPIFMVWSIAILFATLPTDAVLRVFAQTRFLLILNIISLAVIALCIRWFLSRFDLIGAVMITVAAAGLSKGLALLRVKSSAACSHARPAALGSLDPNTRRGDGGLYSHSGFGESVAFADSCHPSDRRCRLLVYFFGPYPRPWRPD